ncbi:PQQ-dependent sugar dehydrogenase [Sphingomonas trueperi]|uniref:PQQ-dependent sugar dehydrogenase n=1 Tax=Sphingomonas trueperi TaxID=53317 RepID=UPI000F27E16B
MNIVRRSFAHAGSMVAPALALVLAACSGDSGSAPPAQPPVNQPPANQPPAFTSGASVSVVENVTGPIYQAAATDPNGDALTYTIAGGADAARFTITAAGQLAFVASPNFDQPADADQNNAYELQIGVSDGKATTTLALTVTVTNDKEGIAVRRVGSGFVQPVAISVLDDSTILVAEKGGAIYQLNATTGAKTLITRIATVGPKGVLAIAVGSTFKSDGTFFAMYHSDSGYLIINRFTRDAFGTHEDARGLVGELAPNYAGGGWLGFTVDGSLYAATGDAGGSGDPTGSAQNDSSVLGKLLRITRNPDPYAGAALRDFLVSMVAKGLHQPSGGSESYASGSRIFISDHGQDMAEELNLLSTTTLSGVNFGWPFKEGTRTVAATPPAGLTDPVLEYYRTGGRNSGQAIGAGAEGPGDMRTPSDFYVFFDTGGAIFTVKGNTLVPGKTVTPDAFERRDADFAPDAGTLSHPVAMNRSRGTSWFYILDAGGDVFRVDPS